MLLYVSWSFSFFKMLTVFLPSNFSGTHCGVRAIDSKCPWCVHYGQGKTIFLLSDELKPRKKIVFPLIITDACFPSCIRPLPALSVPSYRPYLVAPKFTTRPVIVHLQLGLSAAPSYPQVWPSVLFWLRLCPYRGLGEYCTAGVKSAPFYIKNGMSWRKMLLHKVPFIWILRSTLSINISRSGGDPFDR